MFRHKGRTRTYRHNLKLASILSFVAGMVNITGVLSVNILTTNVTGHFAFFSEELTLKNYGAAIAFLMFILAFLFGAFLSNLVAEIMLRIESQMAHVVPMIIEMVTLLCVVFCFDHNVYNTFDSHLIACCLLFAMGVQNSLVTKVSRSVVRTTHLTGLFTDLGIELSQLIFYRRSFEFQRLSKSIFLKLIIILFFFIGGIIGGFSYQRIGINSLLVATGCLVVALGYDAFNFHTSYPKRKGS